MARQPKAKDTSAVGARNSQFRPSWLNATYALWLVLGLWTLSSTLAGAADWPTRPVTVIVPYAAGGFTDTLARLAAKRLTEKLRQPFVVENRLGAGGVIAATYVAIAPPDGYTIMFGSASQLGVSPLIQKVSYSPDQFAPVTVFGTIPFLMAVKTTLAANTVPEFVAYAKANPGKLNYGTAGFGATSHLISAGFAARAGIDMVHVPFKGSAEITAAVVQGTVDMAWGGVSDIAPQMTSHNVRVLAISAAQRLPSLPDIPSIAEFYPGFSLETWNGFLAPHGTPRDIIDKIAQVTIETSKSPDIAKHLIDLGIAPKSSTPDEMAAIIKSEKAFYPDLLKAAGMLPTPSK